MKLLTLTGPSCSGKTTLLNELVANHGFKALVSHTTRPPRPGEVNGKDYHFVNDQDFGIMKESFDFMESVEFNGYQYGLSVDEVIEATKSGLNPVVILEPRGLGQVREYCKNNTIEIFSAFLDGQMPTLLKRYVMRLSGEDLANPKVAERHARRIESLMEEAVHWSSWGNPDGFTYNKDLYNFYAFEYNEYTKDSVIERIIKEYNGKS